MALHRVVALALERLVLLDLAAPAHLFGHLGADRYSFALAGVEAAPVMTTSGFPVDVQAGLGALARADTIVVPGYLGTRRPPDEEALQALRRAAARGARVMSICTGAFALAHAGLLDGRRATTHWDSAADLAAQFPAVCVDPNVLYVDEGAVLTSAGVAAGLDLCLHVVRCDYGAEVAAHLARHTVIAPHRDGSQAQFIERPVEPVVLGAPRLGPTLEWALERIDEPLTVADLARHACVSPRTFARRFRSETGTSSIQWLLAQRVLRAQQLLERDEASIDEIARRCGFADAATLRYHFNKAVGTTPTAYRRTFRTTNEREATGQGRTIANRTMAVPARAAPVSPPHHETRETGHARRASAPPRAAARRRWRPDGDGAGPARGP